MGNVVAIKRIFKKNVDLRRSILKELNLVSLFATLFRVGAIFLLK